MYPALQNESWQSPQRQLVGSYVRTYSLGVGVAVVVSRTVVDLVVAKPAPATAPATATAGKPQNVQQGGFS